MLSIRSKFSARYNTFKDKWKHKINNTVGDMYNLGGADNMLCEDILLQKLQEEQFSKLNNNMLHYPTLHGEQYLREAIATFLDEHLHTAVPLDPEKMLITSGVCAAMDMLAFGIADPGECILCPAPLYTSILSNIGRRGFVTLLPIQTTQKLPDGTTWFQLSSNQVITAYEDAIKKGLVVKGIMLLNPDNPTGQIIAEAELNLILCFAQKYRLHVIMDEIYALSVYEDATFTSVLSMNELPDPQRTHVIWGFSKDFGLSGFRCGVLYSYNEELIQTLKPICFFGAVPGIIQYKLKCLLDDKDWINNIYLPTNRERLRSTSAYVRNRIESMGISFVKPVAGFFIWLNLTKYLEQPLAESEEKLVSQLVQAGLYIEPSSAAYYSDTPGWFRMVFTRPRDYLEKALDVLEQTLPKILTDIEASRDDTQNSISKGIVGIATKVSDNAIKLDLDPDSFDTDIGVVSNSNKTNVLTLGSNNAFGTGLSSHHSESLTDMMLNLRQCYDKSNLKDIENADCDSGNLGDLQFDIVPASRTDRKFKESDSGTTKDNLDNLILSFKENVSGSGWLDKNTHEKWSSENPKLASEWTRLENSALADEDFQFEVVSTADDFKQNSATGGEPSVESLMFDLRSQVAKSDWVKEYTPERFRKENPDFAAMWDTFNNSEMQKQLCSDMPSHTKETKINKGRQKTDGEIHTKTSDAIGMSIDSLGADLMVALGGEPHLDLGSEFSKIEVGVKKSEPSIHPCSTDQQFAGISVASLETEKSLIQTVDNELLKSDDKMSAGSSDVIELDMNALGADLLSALGDEFDLDGESLSIEVGVKK